MDQVAGVLKKMSAVMDFFGNSFISYVRPAGGSCINWPDGLKKFVRFYVKRKRDREKLKEGIEIGVARERAAWKEKESTWNNEKTTWTLERTALENENAELLKIITELKKNNKS